MTWKEINMTHESGFEWRIESAHGVVADWRVRLPTALWLMLPSL